jgi:hypothetical protein
MKNILDSIGTACKISPNEVWLFLLLSAVGWGFFIYSYIFSNGLGAVLPKYAGY